MKSSSKHDEKTKDKLIQAAGEVFAQNGFQSATIREICSRAGTHVGAVNYHFRDKEGLYTAVLEYTHQSMVEKYPADLGLQNDTKPEEKLRAYIHSFLLRILDEGVPAWHGKLMAREIVEPTNALDLMTRKSIQPLYTILENVLREIFHEKNAAIEVKDIDIFLCAMSIVGQCLNYYTSRRVIDNLHPEGFDPTDIEGVANHITRFSLGGIMAFGAG